MLIHVLGARVVRIVPYVAGYSRGGKSEAIEGKLVILALFC
jgi:hypothetical protein